MPAIDRRVDEYISKSAEFAKPILIHLRKLVHTACPNVQETIKWGFPHFDYRGPMCHMASFKHHCVFGFWKAALMKDKTLMKSVKSETAMGHLGKLISLKDLPSDKKLIANIKDAMKLNEAGIKITSVKQPSVKKEIKTPDDFLAALKKSKKALAVFEEFSPSHKREYVEWIIEAKRDETRNKRIKQAIEWMAEGKPRNWKYIK
ncbi:MAG: YdeI/OmpD-associated family protein [Ignavibacterium sp.]|nr:YdeI/OmpD-associated family protein [Ignavibacterium sp.]